MMPKVKALGLLLAGIAVGPALAQTAPVLSLSDIDAIDVPRFGTGIGEAGTAPAMLLPPAISV